MTKTNKQNLKALDLVIFVFLLSVIGYFLFSLLNFLANNFTRFGTFNNIFIGILIQAFPFMLVGVFVSGFMNIFISRETIVKIFPKKYGLGFITAMFAGIFLPVCECAIVPVTSRLVKKGVSLPVAITFMLSAPIINPIVILSTLYAFPEMRMIAFYRVLFGLSIAFIVGMILLIFPQSKSALLDKKQEKHCDCSSCCSSGNNEELDENKTLGEKIKLTFSHVGHEFFDVGKFFIIGAFLTSFIQTFVPREIFSAVSGNIALSLAFMMLLAFLFSVCSTSDAFIARSFWYRFPPTSVMGFMVFGPMMDIKDILMLLASFKKGFVIKLSIIITIVSFIMLYLYSIILI